MGGRLWKATKLGEEDGRTLVPGVRGPCKVCWSLRMCLKLYREKKFGICAGVGWPGQEARDKLEGN